jgi:uncharacterized RDD family membrane protein YckC
MAERALSWNSFAYCRQLWQNGWLMETNLSAEPNAEAKCVECGGTFSTEDMIRHGVVHVCAACKPLFMQKLAEGASIQTGAVVYAGFWRRFGAVCLDVIIMWLVNTGVQFVLLATLVGSTLPTQFSVGTVLLIYAVGRITSACYEVILISKYGATLGKMACNIKVVTADGGPISLSRSLGRHFAKWVSGIILGIGYIIAAFDTQRRSLHDHICNTRVVLT